MFPPNAHWMISTSSSGSHYTTSKWKPENWRLTPITWRPDISPRSPILLGGPHVALITGSQRTERRRAPKEL
eukprot:scaffold177571_cov19-Tisochrysis_lutea.AAC.1